MLNRRTLHDFLELVRLLNDPTILRTVFTELGKIVTIVEMFKMVAGINSTVRENYLAWISNQNGTRRFLTVCGPTNITFLARHHGNYIHRICKVKIELPVEQEVLEACSSIRSAHYIMRGTGTDPTLVERSLVKLLSAGGTHVYELDLVACTNIQPISACTDLQYLDLYGARVTGIQPLAALTALRHLERRMCTCDRHRAACRPHSPQTSEPCLHTGD